MAVLTEEGRAAVAARIMRELAGEMPIQKLDLRAAVDALDTFLESSRAAINAAIPQPARGALTTNQKIAMLAFVLMKRIDDGSDN